MKMNNDKLWEFIDNNRDVVIEIALDDLNHNGIVNKAYERALLQRLRDFQSDIREIHKDMMFNVETKKEEI